MTVFHAPGFPQQCRTRHHVQPSQRQTCHHESLPSFGIARLFLLVGLFLLLGLGTLLALADQTSIGAGIAEFAVCVLRGWVVGDLALLDGDLVGDWEGLVAVLDLAIVQVLANLLGSLDLLLRRIARLWCLGLAWEEDETLLVGLQALDIGLETLLREVLAAWVDADTDSWRKLPWDTSFLSEISMGVFFRSLLVLILPLAQR